MDAQPGSAIDEARGNALSGLGGFGIAALAVMSTMDDSAPGRRSDFASPIWNFAALRGPVNNSRFRFGGARARSQARASWCGPLPWIVVYTVRAERLS